MSDKHVEYGPCSCQDGGRCRYIDGNAVCMSDTPRAALERERAAHEADMRALLAHGRAEKATQASIVELEEENAAQRDNIKRLREALRDEINGGKP